MGKDLKVSVVRIRGVSVNSRRERLVESPERSCHANTENGYVGDGLRDQRGFGGDLYMTFQDGKLMETNIQFAVGLPKAYAARIAAGTR